MKTPHPRPRVPMATIYAVVAGEFRWIGNLTPSHCDVRCAVNDALESYSRAGYAVNHRYSQDRAFRAVRRLLGALSS